MKAQLDIETQKDDLEMDFLISSFMDFEPKELRELAKLTQTLSYFWKQKDSDVIPLDFHFHTFSCPTCPDFIKKDECVSDGQYCAFYPKKNSMAIESKDPEDYTQEFNKNKR